VSGSTQPDTHRKEYALLAARNLIDRYDLLGFSCAETTIRVLRDLYRIEMPDALLKMTSTFRGGASVDGRCGIIEAALSAFSFHIGKDVEQFIPGERMEILHEFGGELQNTFEANLESIQCGRLWGLNANIENIEETECVIRPGGLIAASVYYDYLRDGYQLHDEIDSFIIKEIEKQKKSEDDLNHKHEKEAESEKGVTEKNGKEN
jgi:C_GCAxxG_C_C family probable redox protein